MEKIIQFLTNSQSDAYTVVETLKKLEETNDISLSEVFVIEKDENGKSQLKNSEGQNADATIFGAFIGGIIGLIGGPIGILAGTSLGMLTGSLFDVDKAFNINDYLNTLSKNIPNGKCLVVSHIYEDWETPINSKLSSISQISRISVDEEIDNAIQKDIDAIERDIKTTEIEIKNDVKNNKLELYKKIDELKTKRDNKIIELKNRIMAQNKTYKNWFKKLKTKLENHNSNSI